MDKFDVLYTENLTIGYDKCALLSDLSLSLERGALTCLLGPNGSGKSTLLHTLTGIHDPISGSVFVNNNLIARQTPQELAHQISIVLAEKLTPVNLSVFDVVALGRTPYTNWLGHLSDEDHKAIEKAMELVNITQLTTRSINELSDGEKQRVMIAKALAQDTPLLILDEPTAHLDVSNRVALLTLLKDLAIETNKAILLSTHALEMAIQLADSVWLITKESELITGTPEDLVLSGVIGSTFKGEHVNFDIETGSFKIHHQTKKTIAVVGNGTLSYWTKHALEKEGYKITEREECKVQVILNEQSLNRWKLQYDQTEIAVNSIGELKNKLKLLYS